MSNKFEISDIFNTNGLGPTSLRVPVGIILAAHGAQKLFGWFGGGGLNATAEGFATRLGLEPGMFFAVLVGATEFFGGLLLAAGVAAVFLVERPQPPPEQAPPSSKLP